MVRGSACNAVGLRPSLLDAVPYVMLSVRCDLGLVTLWCVMLCAHYAAYWHHYRCDAVGTMPDLACAAECIATAPTVP